jgi:hypothetical protein
MNPQCDCCLRPTDRLWVYPHHAFCIRLGPSQIQFDRGWWGFCVYCYGLRFDIPALVARVTTLHPAIDRSEAAALYGLFDQVLYGEAREWREGQDIRKRFPIQEAP